MFKYIFKIPTPATPVLAKGTMVHAALDAVFSLKKCDRTPAALHDLLRKAWSDGKKNSTDYASLFPTVSEERAWGLEALSLLNNYLELEDPSTLVADPIRRETWVRAELSLPPRKSSATACGVADERSFLVRGIVDRLDLARVGSDDNTKTVALQVTDYKTGKAPMLKYSAAVNERIVSEKVWQLKIYALLIDAMREKKEKDRGAKVEEGEQEVLPGMPVRKLRIMYLTNEQGRGETIEVDLGHSAEERRAVLREVEEELVGIWMNIEELVEAGDTRNFKHCDRAFCSCHPMRSMFTEGAYWTKSKA